MQDGPDTISETLAFEGAMTIRQAAEAHARLCAALAGEGPVTLDVTGVTAADLSFVQLIESARRTLAGHGRDLALTAPANDALRDVLARGGFLSGGDEARRQFWIQRGVA